MLERVKPLLTLLSIPSGIISPGEEHIFHEDGNLVLKNNLVGKIIFRTESGDPLYLEGTLLKAVFDKQVGIGCEPLTEALSIKCDNGEGDTELSIINPVNENTWFLKCQQTGLYINNNISGLFLDNDGFIGIGNNNPSVGLHVGSGESVFGLDSTNDVIITGKLEVLSDAYFSSLSTPNLQFEQNAGAVVAFDMPVNVKENNIEQSYSFNIGGLPILKLYAESKDDGTLQNKCVHLYGDMGFIKVFVYQNDYFLDDYEISLPLYSTGIAQVVCGGHAGIWSIGESGTTLKLSGSALTTDLDVDGNLCVLKSGNMSIVKNRLGYAAKLRIFFWYN